ncbi:hypothetical protein PCASD_03639 [Puccinia coronata f. sp. avenae]|uniref:Uncharacterized protein n=1 Tax=Puccinia coronata f. sp. avenae TaxID=200324 RepID=A0A2N5V9P5_9BASI|nr:hypothetical protein PCASD_03639 [Puccinia coronata f. sp. avenae]
MFRSKFKNITHYLKRLGYVTNLEDFRENILEVLNSELEITVTRELIRDNKMLVSKDGGEILPDTSTLFNYIHREVVTASVMERRNKFKAAPSNKTQPVQRTTQNPTQSASVKEQEVEQLTKSLSSWSAQKQPTTFYQPSDVPYQPAQKIKPPEQQFCQYCYMRGHPTGRCNLANFDEIQGLVKKGGRDFKLPDGINKASSNYPQELRSNNQKKGSQKFKPLLEFLKKWEQPATLNVTAMKNMS